MDMQTCVADSRLVIVIDAAIAVHPVDVHNHPFHQLDMVQSVHSLAFPIHPNHRVHLIHRVDHPSNTYCPPVIGMMDIVVVVVAMDVGHDVDRMSLVVPLVSVLLHHIGSMHR